MEELSHHLDHLHLSLDPQLVEESGQVLLHLYAVVVHLGHGKNAHFTLPPHLKGKQNMILLTFYHWTNYYSHVYVVAVIKGTESGLYKKKSLSLWLLQHYNDEAIHSY